MNAPDPHQATLEGIAPAAAPQAPIGAVQLALLGELLTHAVVRQGQHGDVKLLLAAPQRAGPQARRARHHPRARRRLVGLARCATN